MNVMQKDGKEKPNHNESIFHRALMFVFKNRTSEPWCWRRSPRTIEGFIVGVTWMFEQSSITTCPLVQGYFCLDQSDGLTDRLTDFQP